MTSKRTMTPCASTLMPHRSVWPLAQRSLPSIRLALPMWDWKYLHLHRRLTTMCHFGGTAVIAITTAAPEAHLETTLVVASTLCIRDTVIPPSCGGYHECLTLTDPGVCHHNGTTWGPIVQWLTACAVRSPLLVRRGDQRRAVCLGVAMRPQPRCPLLGLSTSMTCARMWEPKRRG